MPPGPRSSQIAVTAAILGYPACMGFLDILIAVFVSVAAVYGLLKGFVRIAVGIAGTALAVLFALRFAEYGPSWFANVFSSPQVARAVAFVAVLVAGLMLTGLVAWFARKLVSIAQLGWADRLVGAGIGLVGSSLITSALVVALTTFLPSGSALLANSRLLPVALSISDVAALVLPPKMAETYKQRRDALDVARIEQSREEERVQ